MPIKAMSNTKSSVDEAALRLMITELQSDVVKTRKRVEHASQSNVEAFTMYPPAGPKIENKDIGVILDDQFNVKDLLSANKINPPDGLYWLQLKTQTAFEEFLKRGMPAYISFDSDLKEKGKDGYACAKLFVKAAKAAKLKDLPRWECHSPTIVSKEAIEMLLHSY